jgi:BASS family bile acid:Na+ symporter
MTRAAAILLLQSVALWWTRLFLVWVVLFSVTALVEPVFFTWFKPYVSLTLGIIMFGMGITLTTADFARVARMPRAVVIGILAQYVIMPLLAFFLTRAFNLAPELAMGVIIVGCCPGGTASNVISYLAKADVALSVTLTASTTLLALVVTPLLIQVFGSQYLPVNRAALFLDVFKVTFVPVVTGLVVRRVFGKHVRTLEAVFPAVSVLGICIIIAYVVALSKANIAQLAGLTGLVVVLHNLGGYGFGYIASRLLRLPESACRTIAIEVGMQNSGLAVLLATNHFSALTALPAALFSAVQNLTGAVLATFWRSSPFLSSGASRVSESVAK